MNPHLSPRPLGRVSIGSKIGATWVILLLSVVQPSAARAAESLADALQKGLVAEEVNRDLDTAARAYRTVATLHDAQRATAATAIFRLGEVLRKQGKTSDANTQYERVISEFGDQTALVKLSRQYLGDKAPALAEAKADDVTMRRLEQDLASAEAEASQTGTQIADFKKLSPADLRKVIPTTVNDPRLTSLLIKLNETEQDFAASSLDLGEENQVVKRLVVMIKTVEKQIDTTIDGILLGLETKARSAEARAVQLRKRVETLRKSASPAVTLMETPAVSPPPAKPSPEEQERAEIRRLEEMLRHSPDLLNEGEMLGTPPQASGTPLHLAVARNQFSVVKYLLERGANPNVQNYRRLGYAPASATPLLIATQATNLAMMEFLVANGADVNRGGRDKGVKDQTPLQYAVSLGHVPVVALLLKLGAEVNAPADSPPLADAARIGHKTIVEMLLAKGANPDAGDKISDVAESLSPLHLAAQASYRAVAEVLLAGGANINITNERSRTPLYVATAGNQAGMVAWLLEKGADPKIGEQGQNTGLTGVTPLHLAAQHGYLEVIRKLLERGAEVNQTNSHGQTALWAAAAFLRHTTPANQEQVCELLLAKGADPNVSARYPLAKDTNPLRPAWPFGSRRGQGTQPALITTLWDDRGEAITRSLLDHKADVNARDDEGWGALHTVALNRTPEIAWLLVQKQADVNARNGDGNTPLHLAVARLNTPMVEFLLERGAEVNARNKAGFTALDILQGKPLYGVTARPIERSWLNVSDAEFSARQTQIEAMLKAKGAELGVSAPPPPQNKVMIYGDGIKAQVVLSPPGEQKTLLAVLQAAGLTPGANLTKIKLLRLNPVTQAVETRFIDVVAIQEANDPKLDVVLQGGDKIEILEKAPAR